MNGDTRASQHPAVGQDGDLGPAVARLVAGDARTLSRAMSLVENHDPRGVEMLTRSFGHGVEPWVVGMTGVGGAGKSTVLPLLAHRLVAAGERVAILAIDPSSPFTGGALLGDRIRSAREQPSEVFFRSLGSRGAAGGLAACVADLVRLAGAAGRTVVIVETVGAGQSEVAIRHVAHSVVVVTAPGLGDDVQAIKAGILEIANVVAVNKADRPDAAQAANQLRQALHLAADTHALAEGSNDLGEGRLAWFPPVLEISARNDAGIDGLLARLSEHRAFLDRTGARRALARARAAERLTDCVRAELFARHRARWGASGRWTALVATVASGERDPLVAARDLLDDTDN
ncbi:MAG: methylmalonyl Co-A mutase-associated GTPase MeaB [Casimicrobiaceae bacterium]